MNLTRRDFVVGLPATVLGVMSGAFPRQEKASERVTPGGVIDFHVHLFGIGDGGSGCVISAKQRRHWTYSYFLRLLNLSENGHMDEDYVQRLVTQLRLVHQEGGRASVGLSLRRTRTA